MKLIARRRAATRALTENINFSKLFSLFLFCHFNKCQFHGKYGPGIFNDIQYPFITGNRAGSWTAAIASFFACGNSHQNVNTEQIELRLERSEWAFVLCLHFWWEFPQAKNEAILCGCSGAWNRAESNGEISMGHAKQCHTIKNGNCGFLDVPAPMIACYHLPTQFSTKHNASPLQFH